MTFLAALAALVFLALSAYLFGVGEPLVAVVSLLMVLAALVYAASHTFVGACPACGTQQKHIGGLHRCNNCLLYGKVEKGEYRELESDYTAKTPLLALPLPAVYRLPNL
jgi:hypothetical protein